MSKVASGRNSLNEPVKNIMFTFNAKKKPFVEVTQTTPLESLSSFFEKHSSAIVTERTNGDLRVKHIVTKVDLLGYLLRENKL